MHTQIPVKQFFFNINEINLNGMELPYKRLPEPKWFGLTHPTTIDCNTFSLNILIQRFPTFLCSRTPKQKNKNRRTPQLVFKWYFIKLYILHSMYKVLFICSFFKVILIKIYFIYGMSSCLLVIKWLNSIVKIIWSTPRDFSRTPGGTRTPGWEMLS